MRKCFLGESDVLRGDLSLRLLDDAMEIACPNEA